MADEVDRTEQNESLILEASIQHVTAAAARIPKGHPGNCFYCGENSPRLVGEPGACAPCRDRRGLP